MNPNKSLTKREIDIVRMQYLEGLCNQEVAEKLGLRLHQVKYRVKKMHVKKYIDYVITPYIRKQRIAELEAKLANLIKAFAEQICEDVLNFWLSPAY